MTAKDIIKKNRESYNNIDVIFSNRELIEFCEQLLNEFEKTRTGSNLLTGYVNFALKTGEQNNITFVQDFIKNNL